MEVSNSKSNSDDIDRSADMDVTPGLSGAKTECMVPQGKANFYEGDADDGETCKGNHDLLQTEDIPLSMHQDVEMRRENAGYGSKRKGESLAGYICPNGDVNGGDDVRKSVKRKNVWDYDIYSLTHILGIKR